MGNKLRIPIFHGYQADCRHQIISVQNNILYDLWGNLLGKNTSLLLALVNLHSLYAEHGFPDPKGSLRKTVNSPLIET